MNSQVDPLSWNLRCCSAGAAVWKDKAMAEQKLLHLTLPELQDSPTSQSFSTSSVIVGNKAQDRMDQQVSRVNLRSF